MKLLRIISFPLVPLYYFVTWLRNLCYDIGVFKSKSYDLPIICVGNLSVGGTGKSPMVEYLIRLLKDHHKLATLSRGYKRKTKGFVQADTNSKVGDIGDEPLQFYKKFNDIVVAVDANRQRGVSKLMAQGVETIILDDAFQHRKVKAGLTILLTTYDKLYSHDHVLPTGNLREPRNGAKRADIIVVTKCPYPLNDYAKDRLIEIVKPLEHQSLFFSSIEYSETVFSSNKEMPLYELKGKQVTLVTGIADPKPLITFLDSRDMDYEHLKFKDHHDFTNSEIKLLQKKDVILTTEKDHMRLKGHIDAVKLYFLPISFKIDYSKEFDERVNDFVTGFKKQ